MKIKIFLAEDDPLMSDMYARIFKLNGFDFSIASNGQEAIDTLKSMNPKPTVVLLDVMMPKKSGFDVLKEMKEDPPLKNIPVIMLTNLSSEKDVEKALSLGAVLCLTKSQFSTKEVIIKIKEIILDTGKKDEFEK